MAYKALPELLTTALVTSSITLSLFHSAAAWGVPLLIFKPNKYHEIFAVAVLCQDAPSLYPHGLFLYFLQLPMQISSDQRCFLWPSYINNTSLLEHCFSWHTLTHTHINEVINYRIYFGREWLNAEHIANSHFPVTLYVGVICLAPINGPYLV